MSIETQEQALAESVHLAELIEEEMCERGWDLDRHVMEMGPFFTKQDWGICKLSWEMFLTVREPYVLLGDVMAGQLGDAFGVSPRFFLNFHEMWRKSQNQDDDRKQDV